MKSFFAGVIFCFAWPLHQAQSDYFQQKVDIKIEVYLNDKNHTLSAFEEIVYHNNSDDTLHFIYIHLWPNAYQSTHTALGKQLLEEGNTNLYFAYNKDKGYIDSLNFKENEKELQWEFYEKHKDIAIVHLSEPLLPNRKTTISTPFKVKFPSSKISRMGHVGESYQVTQWYPKPAVYDKNGWHPIPYLNQGEFYSEYGEFDIKITLPKNYVVGATGDLINGKEELKWLNERHKKTLDLIGSTSNKSIYEVLGDDILAFPKSSREMKTLHYRQQNIHDFAWFADKRFNVLKDSIQLPHSKKWVTTWLMFTNNEFELWKNATPYINDAIYYYSLWNGDYPYNQVTAVDGTISAGGGMEYPNVTIIGESGNAKALERVIVHEVGHNWYYGILGSNERKNAWMDEGMNSFMENRYFYTKYPNHKLINSPAINNAFNLDEYSQRYLSDISYIIPASYNVDQPIQLHSAEYTPLNYGAVVYSKTAIMFDYLKAYLGEDIFDACIKNYYETWKFKHPQPRDVQLAFEATSGQDLTWFFEDMLRSAQKIDYKVQKVIKKDGKTQVTIKNNGGLTAPVSVTAFGKNDTLSKVWSSSIKNLDTLLFNHEGVHHYQINGLKVIPELNSQNNYIRQKGLFKKTEPIQFQWLGGLDNPGKTLIYYSPILGWNNYDKLMLGLAFYNHLAIKKPFEYTLAPMYSFGRNTLTGLGNLEYTISPENRLKYISFGLNAAQFSTFNSDDLQSDFKKITPYVNIEIKPKDQRRGPKQTIESKLHTIHNSFTTPELSQKEFLYVSSNSYRIVSKQVLKPKSLMVNYTQGIVTNTETTNYGKLSLEGKYRINYDEDLNGVQFRLFAGSFLFNNTRSSRFNFYEGGSIGRSDVTYSNVFLARNDFHPGILWQQMVFNEGALRTYTPFSSNSWLISLNNDIDLPMRLPFNLYFDVAFFPFTTTVCNSSGCTSQNSISTNFAGGLSFKVIKNVFEIYVPLFVSQDLKDIYEFQDINFLQRIRFTFNINQLNPFKLIEQNIN